VIRAVLGDVFLVLAVAVLLASAVGVLVMRGVYEKLHFVTPASLVAPALATLAVLMKAGFSATTAEAALALLFMAISGPYLSHATIRAARNRETGDWRRGHGGTPPAHGGEAS
jgi:multisubunit Na+/H+ antiporter MnhG subunit